MARHALTGKLVSGLGEGAGFTRTEWARRQFVELLGIDPYPGTLNLLVEDEDDFETWRAIRKQAGLTVAPPDPSWCNGTCYPATIGGAIKGAIVVPEIADYPTDKIEIIAEVELRRALGLADGDPVTLDVEA
ncbi:MAG: DUF120 domain-containing protein [Alphaproteobacteria bacterium]